MQLLILYSHKNDDAYMNGNYCAEIKYVEVLLDQIGQIQKMKCFRTKWVTHIIYNEPVDNDEKGQR